MDLKYIIWNYQAKRLHFTYNRKIWTYQLKNLMLQTFNALDIINVVLYITHKLPVQHISVQVHILGTNWLKDFLQKTEVNGHPPVCVCKCIFKASGCLKDFLHTAHMNGHCSSWGTWLFNRFLTYVTCKIMLPYKNV